MPVHRAGERADKRDQARPIRNLNTEPAQLLGERRSAAARGICVSSQNAMKKRGIVRGAVGDRILRSAGRGSRNRLDVGADAAAR